MLKLIKLEWKKNNIGKYIRNAVILAAILCLLSLIHIYTRQHNTWRFYGEQTRDTVLAYLVELTGKEDGKLKGNLYAVSYTHLDVYKRQRLHRGGQFRRRLQDKKLRP